jgi:hypothetical protein
MPESTGPHPAGPDSQEPIDPEIVDPEIVDPAIAHPAIAVPDHTPAPPPPTTGYDERGVPTFDHVRDKIEGRYTTSIGAAELAEATAAGRSVEEQEAEREAKAKAKLEEIRRSMGG